LSKGIPEETKERIRRAARELGYEPNDFARYLRSKRSGTVGIVVYDISDPYCAQILRGAQAALYRHERYLPIVADAQNDKARFQRHVRKLIERQVEGLIVLGNSMYPERDLLRTLQDFHIPTVIIGRQLQSDSVASVTVDNEAGARLALEHLHELGHRRIAFIRGPRAMIDSSQRWHGVRSFARKAKLAIDPRLVLTSRLPETGQEVGYELTTKLVRAGKPFTAVHAYDDVTAYGVIRALAEHGIDVPGKCSVTGFDDIPISAYFNPPLTTIRQDLELQGCLGAEVLLDALPAKEGGRERAPKSTRLAPRLVVRATTAPPPPDPSK
jgi:LacI family transcriptional regulator